MLGKGKFGSTRLCTHFSTGQKYACKSISKRTISRQEELEDVRREVQVGTHHQGWGLGKGVWCRCLCRQEKLEDVLREVQVGVYLQRQEHGVAAGLRVWGGFLFNLQPTISR